MKSKIGKGMAGAMGAGLLSMVAMPAFATVASVPEPSVLGLLAAAGIAGGILYLRGRRK